MKKRCLLCGDPESGMVHLRVMHPTEYYRLKRILARIKRGLIGLYAAGDTADADLLAALHEVTIHTVRLALQRHKKL